VSHEPHAQPTADRSTTTTAATAATAATDRITADRLDLVVRGGTVVTADGEARADVGIAGGVIVQLGGPMAGADEIDATGMIVLPGGIDLHVHLEATDADRTEPRWVDDFASGSRAAAAGGITTIGAMVFPNADPAPGELPLASVERMAADAARVSIVDFVLHPVLMDPRPEVVAQIPALAEQGHTTIKIFTAFGDFDARAGAFLQALETAGRHGVLTMVHCEDGPLVEHAITELVAAGRGSLDHYAETRTPSSESAAVARMIAWSEAVDAPVYVVHLGGAAALAEARSAQARGLAVYVETRPLYLHFTRESFAGPDGPLYVGDPPLGTAADLEALWAGLAAGHVHTCCTDHAPWTRADKLDPELTVATARAGVSDLETMLPMLWAAGVGRDRLSRQRFVQVTSTNAARLTGMFPRKGTVAVGSDADLAIWDPALTRTVDGAAGSSRAGHSLHDGWTTTGWPVTTISRGVVVHDRGASTGAAGHGTLVRRGPTSRL